MLRNNASGPEIGLPGRISAGFNRGSLLFGTPAGAGPAGKFIGLGAIDVTKPYKFTSFGAMEVTKPYHVLHDGSSGPEIGLP